MNKIEDCENNTAGMDLDTFIYDSSKSRIYYHHVAEEKYKESGKTYDFFKKQCQDKYIAEQLRIKEMKLLEQNKKKQQAQKENEEFAKSNGYKGYIKLSGFHSLIYSVQSGETDIGKYKNYVIKFDSIGTKAYRFSQLINGIEIYQPVHGYHLKPTIGIRRNKVNENLLVEGQPLTNIEYVSFEGIDSYTTVLGASKQIVMFNRATNFKVAYIQQIFKNISQK